uniref:Uncharacterized protein n=1 Tax=viral metagenome TaxID=1070528 RepID=A0A6C0KQP7_9ZZZZ
MSSSNNDFIKSISSDFPDELTPLPEISNPPSWTLSSVSWQIWIIIILILALIGFNIFIYLAKGTDFITNIFYDIFGPILKLLGYSTLETTNQTIQTSSTGAKAGIDVISNTSETTFNALNKNNNNSINNNLPQGQIAESSQQGTPIVKPTQNSSEDSLEKALQNASQNISNQGPSPNESSKAGWCFIGDDQGFRACSQVGVNDVCMSGDIFPSQEICMNPNLRA